MAFIDQGEFEVMKTLSGHRAPCCGKHQFRATRAHDDVIFIWEGMMSLCALAC